MLVHFGMLLAALAFASWWTSNTVLDTARTRGVTHAVLEDADLRSYVAGRIAPVVAQAVPPASLRAATGKPTTASTNAAVEGRLTTVLDRPDIRTHLEQFVVDLHRRLVGEGTGPAILDKSTIATLVAAAVPNLSAADRAKIPPVRVTVPRFGPIAAGRSALQHRMLLYALGAIVLLAAAIATSRDRRATVKLVGAWLVGISVAHLLVLWVIPVVIVPHLTSSPWAGLISGVARALSADLVTGLVVLAAAGVAFLLADRFVPAAGTSAEPVPRGVTPDV